MRTGGLGHSVGETMSITVQEDGSAELHDQAAAAARAYLEGRAGAVETSRQIFEVAVQIDECTTDLMMGFTSIASETDEFPLGEVRAAWSAAALEREDAARLRYEAEIADDMNRLCSDVVKAFSAR
jgi:hypothetical protein